MFPWPHGKGAKQREGSDAGACIKADGFFVQREADRRVGQPVAVVRKAWAAEKCQEQGQEEGKTAHREAWL